MVQTAAEDAPQEKAGGVYSDSALSFAIALLDDVSDLVAAVNTQLRLVAINGAFRRAVARNTGQLPELGEPLAQLLAGLTGDEAKAQALCRRVASAPSGASFQIRTPLMTGNGASCAGEMSFRRIATLRDQPAWTGIVIRLAGDSCDEGLSAG